MLIRCIKKPLIGFLVLIMSVEALRGDTVPQITHGVVVGDVSEDSAVIWVRADREALLHLLVHSAADERQKLYQLEAQDLAGVYRSVKLGAESDFTGKLNIENLCPDTVYRYDVWLTGDEESHDRSAPIRGHFRTAPDAKEAREIRFAWSGDLAGQNVCRDEQEGFPIFNVINQETIDFFIGLGDMIYADNVCTQLGTYGNKQIAGDFGKASTLEDFWAHWRYNREDAGFSQLLANVTYYAVWDDHEVVNDFDPFNDTQVEIPYAPDVHLMPLGLKAFLDYNPVIENSKNPDRLYRNFRWGQHLELFLLDTRQYRDPNSAEDTAAWPKTLLGREQLTWLKSKLLKSDATWKVIVSSVPMSVPTGWPPEFPRDGWANYGGKTGYERELKSILSFMQEKGMRNIVWLTTDVHFAEVFRYTPFSDAPEFKIYELAVGPLNAGVSLKEEYDHTFKPERLFIYGWSRDDFIKSWDRAKQWFNYGVIHVTKEGKLDASVRNANNQTVFNLSIDPD